MPNFVERKDESVEIQAMRLPETESLLISFAHTPIREKVQAHPKQWLVKRDGKISVISDRDFRAEYIPWNVLGAVAQITRGEELRLWEDLRE